MNEFLRSDEVLTDEEIVLCTEAARLWEEGCNDEEERKMNNGNLQRKR